MNSRALDRLLRDQQPRIRAVCLRILGNPADADDATQNALIRITRSIDSFDGRSSLDTWVYRIATNAALDELRRRNRRPLSLVGDHDVESPDQMSLVDDSDEMARALAALPEDYRVAVVLRDIGDLDYDQIADVLGIPGGTVRSRIARGRARLAEILGNPNDPSERLNPGRPT
mgnify:CR=1 FL=1